MFDSAVHWLYGFGTVSGVAFAASMLADLGGHAVISLGIALLGAAVAFSMLVAGAFA